MRASRLALMRGAGWALALVAAAGLAGPARTEAAGAAPATIFEERPAPPTAVRSDPALRARFLAEYTKAGAGEPRKGVVQGYLTTLGVAGILDALEERFPNCHGEAHEVGKAAYAATRDMPAVLAGCSTRCVSGCMHGALMEAFSVEPDRLRAQVATFCDRPEMRRLHKRGDCVHGVGHGVAYVTGYDMPRALALCETVGEVAYQYYCASGAYMQMFMTFGEKIAARADHYPCDEARRFAAACYRYEVFFLLARATRAGRGLSGVIAECLALPPRVQPACFHGLGHASVGPVAESPPRIHAICEHGGAPAQWLCIQGVVEKLAEVDEPAAGRVCAELAGRNAEVCREAARNKLYATRKAGLEYYLVGR